MCCNGELRTCCCPKTSLYVKNPVNSALNVAISFGCAPERGSEHQQTRKKTILIRLTQSSKQGERKGKK